jgi:hypothetical protein
LAKFRVWTSTFFHSNWFFSLSAAKIVLYKKEIKSQECET